MKSWRVTLEPEHSCLTPATGSCWSSSGTSPQSLARKCSVCLLPFGFYLCLSLLEIDRYIGLPIFFLIFKHFTIICYRFFKKKYIGFEFFFFSFFFFYIIIQSITSSEILFSAFDPSKCTHTWSSGHCSLRRSSSTTTACNFIQN